MKKLLIIFNPLAGKGSIRGHLPGVLDVFTKAGYLVTAYPTQCKGDATQAAAQLAGGYDRVVCCGGDGTLSETVAGLIQLEHSPVLGYLPAGTTNDFSRNLNLPKELEAAAQTAVSGPIRGSDVGMFNQRSFIYVAAFGAFTDVAYGTSQEIKNMFGHLAYLMEGVSRLGSIKSYWLHIEHDDGILEGDFFYGMVSNTISVGGFKGLPFQKIELDDGLFEVVLVKRPKSLAELQSIVMALLQQKTVPGGAVVSFRTAQLRMVCRESLPWTLDGEYGGSPRVAVIQNRQKAVRLVCGE